MTNLTVFDFHSNQVRVLVIDGETWFVAKDLCKVLDVSNPSQALSRLEDDEKRTLTREQVVILNDDPDTTRLSAVSESGMFALVLTSRKPEARPFRKWVTSEVLPSIRKTGGYSIAPVQLPQLQEIGIAIDVVFAATAIDARLTAGVKANQIAKIYPSLASAMEESKALLGIEVEEKLVRPGKLAELYEAKTGTKLSARKINTLLMDKGLQVKNPSGTNPCWLPTDQGEEYSQLVLDTAKGHNKTVQSLQWYPSVVDVI
jgi:prophage antirepressor-like protein